jgi:uncharacterized alkaline shock family protein YloU
MLKNVIDQEMETKLAELEAVSEITVNAETSIDDEVIAAIAGVACREVDGITSLGTTSIRKNVGELLGMANQRARGVTVEAGRREAILDIEIHVLYGHSIPSVVVQARQNVARRLLEFCGLVAKEINVQVVGMGFPDRMPGRVE